MEKIVSKIPRNSDYEVWNIGEHNREFTNKCLVPFVLCDENYHVTHTIYLRVECVEDAEILLNAACIGSRKEWESYTGEYRKEAVQKAVPIIEKYLI